MSNKNSSLPILLVVLVVVIIASGALWWIMTQSSNSLVSTPPEVSTTSQQTINTKTQDIPSTPMQSATAVPEAVTQSSSGYSTYSNSNYGFSLQYPSGVQMDTNPASQHSYTANIHNGTQVAVIGPIQKEFTATASNMDNGATGQVTISVSKDSTDVATCMVAPSDDMNPATNITNKTINGINFLSYEVDQSAAGSLSLDHTYTTLHNGTCYSIDSNINGEESSHMNASDGAANNAVIAKLTAELDSIATSFTFQ